MKKILALGFLLSACQAVEIHVDGGDCMQCHEDEYEEANFNHDAVGLDDDCDECHLFEEWYPAKAPDHQFFPLNDGRHDQLRCGRCHPQGQPRSDPDCFSCHPVKRPDHGSFSSECEKCHPQQAWKPIQHEQLWPQEGIHARLECEKCHPKERYTGTPRECIGCHRALKEVARPTHARFSDDCLECHNQERWVPSLYQHSPFKVPHHSMEICLSCHPDPEDYGIFDCLSCHPQEQMDSVHQAMGRYRYESVACLRCHPRGL